MENQKKNASLKVPAIVISVTCIVILVIVLILKSIESMQYGILITIVYPLVEMLCSIAITASIGTYLIEWKGFMDYVQNRLSELLAKPTMINNLSPEYQKELLSHLIYETTAVESDSFKGYFNELYKNLDYQAKEYGYYLLKQENKVKCELYKDTQNNLLIDSSGNKYRISRHTRISTYSKLIEKEVKLTDILSVNVIEDSVVSGNKAVQVTAVKIGYRKLEDKDYTVNIKDNEDKMSIDTQYKRTYVCSLVKPIIINNGTMIEIKYTTIEPMYDFSYCTRMKQFCKEFKMDFSYSKNELIAYGQSFVCCRDKKQDISDDSISLEIYDWLMPGEGSNIFIGEK